jgi:hypothetical protein
MKAMSSKQIPQTVKIALAVILIYAAIALITYFVW